MIFKMSQESY